MSVFFIELTIPHFTAEWEIEFSGDVEFYFPRS